MTESKRQVREWMGPFGEAYTHRNTLPLADFEALYKKQFGSTRTEMNQKFLKAINRTAKILEVGANSGNQLLCLQQMGFQNLCGIEPQAHALKLAKTRLGSKTPLIQATAFQLPFKDGSFDLVFTSGVLIHIAPADIGEALKEIHRCSRRYIWGWEYWAAQWTEVQYRGHEALLWKTDYGNEYLTRFQDLKMLQTEKFQYQGQENSDAMFLLEKA